jgi:four helix bundle protein
MSNIAEGFGRRSDLELASSLSIAHGSVAEAQSLLYVRLDQMYIP